MEDLSGLQEKGVGFQQEVRNSQEGFSATVMARR